MSDIRISEIKQKAWNDLSGKWGDAALTTLVYFLVALGAAFVPLGSILVSGPLSVGFVLYFVYLIKKKPVRLGLIFEAFQFYGNALLTYFLRMILVFLAASPLIIVSFVLAFSLADPSGAKLFFVFILFLVFLALPLYIGLRLGVMYFIVADNPKVSADNALEISWKMMKGHEWDLLLLTLSFILWYLLSIVTLGIGFLWLMPYYYTSVGHFYMELKHRYPAYAEMIDAFGNENRPDEPMDEVYLNQ